MTSGWPAGILVNGGTDPLNAIRLKTSGTQSGVPAVWSRPAGAEWVADFSLSEPGGLRHEYSDIAIDAISTGNAIIPEWVGTPGLLQYPDAWFALTLSIKNGGAPDPGSVLAGLNAGSTIGSDTVGYYFEGSTGISSRLIGETVLETRRRQFGLHATPNRELSGMDYGIGLMTETDQGSRLFPNTHRLYFSVSWLWANDFGQNYSGFFARASRTDPFANVVPNPGDIYCVEWTAYSPLPAAGQPLGEWSIPFVAVSSTQLGLAQGGDVDALEVHRGSAVPTRLIFSATQESSYASAPNGESQLMVWQGEAGHSNPLQVTNSSGSPVKVADEAGVSDNGTTDIDAVCGIDPELGSGSYNIHVGIPVAEFDSPTERMGLSICRREGPYIDSGSSTTGGGSTSAAPSDELFFEVAGWGDTTPQTQLVYLAELNAGQSSPFTPGSLAIDSEQTFTIIGVKPRAASTEWVHFTRKVPTVMLGHMPTSHYVGIMPNRNGPRTYSLISTIAQ